MLSQLLNDPLGALLSLLFTLPALLVGFTVHEFCHAAVAVKLGDDTPRLEGRMTLDPMAHIDWLGLLFFVLLGWGYAKPVRINPSRFKNRRWDSMWVALAGPVSNFVVAAVFFCLYRALPEGVWTQFLYYGVTVNLTLFALNLLPVPPLDGFGVLRAFLPAGNGKIIGFLERYGFVVLLLLSFAGVLSFYFSWALSLSFRLFFLLFGVLG